MFVKFFNNDDQLYIYGLKHTLSIQVTVIVLLSPEPSHQNYAGNVDYCCPTIYNFVHYVLVLVYVCLGSRLAFLICGTFLHLGARLEVDYDFYQWYSYRYVQRTWCFMQLLMFHCYSPFLTGRIVGFDLLVYAHVLTLLLFILLTGHLITFLCKFCKINLHNVWIK